MLDSLTIEMRALVRTCSLGKMLMAATARGVCLVSFDDDADALWADLRRRFPHARVQRPLGDRALDVLADRLVQLLDATGGAAAIPLDVQGTPFQQKVWRALRDIPAGQTTTYAQIARQVGAPRAVRAVASACGANPVALAVPCHRVLRTDGGLGGYRWGLGRKRALLARERSR